ncbi:MAG: hypothetical protein GTO02_14015 [Candidatus Dadabacteria bacterium]|nr:hypothetical protein [Candidatus Dadabacteria bacterium]NIQ15464.1 hypothetical protein [Candidatus Dadabacteria bacterium]
MSESKFPELNLEGFNDTRDAIHLYSKILRNIRSKFTPYHKHYWHISLRTWAQGFTTTPVAINTTDVFEIFFNLLTHKIEIATNSKKFIDINIEGQSQKELAGQILDSINNFGFEIRINLDDFTESKLSYTRKNAEAFFNAYSIIDILLKRFRSGFKEECGPVQVWPHHLDIAFRWFSGNKIPVEDPSDVESSDEQIGYGFITGDTGIEEPYFYVLPYPSPTKPPEENPLHGGTWQTENWSGAVLKYNKIYNMENPHRLVLEFFNDVHNKYQNQYIDQT